MNKQDKLEKDDLYWIEMMIYFAQRSLEYYEEIRCSSYSTIVMESLDDALASQIAHIGEQLSEGKLSKEIRAKYPHIPWRQIKDYRNKHNHWYQDIRMSQVYEIAEDFLEDLIYELEMIRKDLLSKGDS